MEYSNTFDLWSRLGCTLASVFLMALSTPLDSSKFCANTSSCSATSANNTPSLSLMSLRASSPESSGCWMPRSEATVKRCLGALFSEAPVLSVLLDRTERERFLVF